MAAPGDTVELERFELVDASMGPVAVTALAVDMSMVDGDAIGMVLASEPMGAAPAVAALVPLAGFTFRSEDGIHNAEIVLRVEGRHPGVAMYRSGRITFSVNGGSSQTQDVPSALRLCVDDPAPSTCDEAELP
jgi:hypothetical protein